MRSNNVVDSYDEAEFRSHIVTSHARAKTLANFVQLLTTFSRKFVRLKGSTEVTLDSLKAETVRKGQQMAVFMPTL